MNKSIRKACSALLLLAVVVSVVCCGQIFGYSESYYEDKAFVAKNMEVDCVVNTDYTYDITQKIVVKFNMQRYGIIIDLPTNSGEGYTDIKVISKHNYSIEKDLFSDFTSIKIGNEDYYANPEETYEISYTLKTPPIKDYTDVAYFNVLGNGWSSKIEAFSATIHLPSKANSIVFGMGETSTPDSSKFDSVQTDNKLTFSLKKGQVLQPFKGISVRADFPAGTFKEEMSFDFLWAVIASILGLALVYLLYNKFGREKAIVPVINFAPPEGMSPAEMGAWIDGSCSGEDVTSLIYYWASKGYISIFTDEDGENVELRMLEPIASSSPQYEITLFNALFSNRPVLKIDGVSNFGSHVVSAQHNINAAITPKLYDGKSKAWSVVGLVAAVLLYGLGVLLIGLRTSLAYFNFFGFVAGGFFLLVYMANYALIYNEHKMKKSTFLAARYGLLAVCALICFVVGGMTSNLVFQAVEAYSLIACGTLMAFVSPYIFRRSNTYNLMLNQIMGFREFIEKAEVDKLKLLLEGNPQYYYEILPYANVLGLTDVWADKFKSLTLTSPSYYSGNITMFDVLIFNRIFRNSYRNMRTSFTPPPPTGRSGGGFGGLGGGGGGSFGGGGFGGGGGRSW